MTRAATAHIPTKQTPKGVWLDAEKIFVSHSGGKDSQAMLAYLLRIGVPRDKLVVVHADLGEMEWEHMGPWIKQISFGLDVHIVKPWIGMFDLTDHYGYFPAGKNQMCTDWLKIRPIGEWIRNYCDEHGITGMVINAVGICAHESEKRRLQTPWKPSDMVVDKTQRHPREKSKAVRSNHNIRDWYPIFNHTAQEVHDEIKKVGQKIHWVYGIGMSRLSCSFCFFGRVGETKIAAKWKPELGKKIARLEQKYGRGIHRKQVNKKKVPKYLPEYTDIKLD